VNRRDQDKTGLFELVVSEDEYTQSGKKDILPEEWMTDKIEAKGKIDVAQAAIASIVNEAVQTCYGVVGTVPKNFATGLVDILSTDRKRGVEVVVRDGEIIIDLYIVVEYGTRISSVAHSIKQAVKYQVEKALELPVVEVNVHVHALRVSDFE
jgi:uncharacterized alkaline shock family protein YloU